MRVKTKPQIAPPPQSIFSASAAAVRCSQPQSARLGRHLPLVSERAAGPAAPPPCWLSFLSPTLPSTARFLAVPARTKGLKLGGGREIDIYTHGVQRGPSSQDRLIRADPRRSPGHQHLTDLAASAPTRDLSRASDKNLSVSCKNLPTSGGMKLY